MTDDTRVRPFADVLQDLDRGAVARKLGDELHDLIAAIAATGKAGSLTLQIKIKPATKVGDEAVTVGAVVKVSRPAPDMRESLFFFDGDHNLSRDHPVQPTLPLREVDTPAAPSHREAEAR